MEEEMVGRGTWDEGRGTRDVGRGTWEEVRFQISDLRFEIWEVGLAEDFVEEAGGADGAG